MYRNIGNFSRGCDPSSGAGSPRPTTANSRTADSDITTTQAEQQKLSLGNSAGFVPSLNTITTSQDLQWLVQPSLWPPAAGPPAPPLPPYPTQGTVRCSPSPLLHHPVPPPRGAIARPPSTRRRPDEHLTPEELERRRIRRERNKLAAAKCRDRRRVLTDTLQTETDRLESDKAELQREIAGLEKEKERLELVLEAHRPICKIHSSDSDSDHSSGIPAAGPKSRIKTEPEDPPVAGPSHQHHQRPSKPKITLPASSRDSSPPDTESLHTPTFISTPSLTPFTASLVFTYPPTAPPDPGAPATAPHHFSPPASSSAQLGTIHSASTQRPQACATAHRRSSSSGDQSDHSLNSPTLVTL